MPKKILKLRKGISSMRSGLIKKYQEIMKHECEHANFTFVLFLKWHEIKECYDDMCGMSQQQEKSIILETTMLWCTAFKISFFDI